MALLLKVSSCPEKVQRKSEQFLSFEKWQKIIGVCPYIKNHFWHDKKLIVASVLSARENLVIICGQSSGWSVYAWTSCYRAIITPGKPAFPFLSGN